VSPPAVRILYLADIRFPLERANGIQSAETCHALASRGHDVTMLVRPDTASPPRDPLAFYGLAALDTLRIVRVGGRGSRRTRRMAYLAAALGRSVRSDRYDAVYTRDLGAASWVVALPRSLRPPLLYESHGLAHVFGASIGRLLSDAESASPRKQRRLAARERRVWRGADGYVTITAALGRDLERAWGVRDHTAVVPDGMRLPRERSFVPPCAGPDVTVAYAGHLYPWKGVETLLRALAALPRARGLVVGGHPAEADLPKLRALAQQLGLAARVEFTGMLPPPDVAAQLARADILALPNSATTVSATYTSPLKLFEYLAAGKAIVASDLPSLREVLVHEGNALLVAPDDAGDLAAAVARLASDRDLAGRLARAAFDLAPEFTWDRRAGRLEALLITLRGSRRD
jgi:glycosyltransferase involved in cell wall biosynthesis